MMHVLAGVLSSHIIIVEEVDDALCWLVVEFKEKNSILDRDLNPGL